MAIYETVLGSYEILEHNGYITRVKIVSPNSESTEPSVLTDLAFEQLCQYLKGERKEFDLPLNMNQGTPFQQKVWRALLDIPYGKIVSYGDIAKAIGQPTASRAVGGANNRNPISIIVPCHRVVGSSGNLVGYASGLDAKRFLLELESMF